jgi:hypothetical protein
MFGAVPQLRIRCLVVHVVVPPLVEGVSVQQQVASIQIGLHLLGEDTGVQIARKDSTV